MDDEVIRGTTVTHEGSVTWPPPAVEPSPTVSKTEAKAPPQMDAPAEPKKKFSLAPIFFALALASIVAVGAFAPESFLAHFTVFVLAIFVGWHVIWNVTPALHTPLMSVTNAISGIIIVGALLGIGASTTVVAVLAAVSILIASINIFGGFYVTHRMLKMFRK